MSTPSAPRLPRRHILRTAAGLCAACLAAPALLRQALARGGPRFGLGMASGHPQPQGVVLWTRLTGEGLPQRVQVAWELAEDEGFARVVARGVEAALDSDAHSVHAEPAGLAPGRPYWYRFSALGERSPTGRTRTAPAPGQTAALRLATASCQRLEHGYFAAWRDIVAFEPDLVLFLGDYIYEYPGAARAVRTVEGGLVRTLEGYRQRYAQYRADPLLQAAHAAAPWAVVWDDHEVANDYAGLQGGLPLADFPAQRAAAYQAFWEHMPLPRSARPQGPHMRLYSHLDWGRLARILLLDNRQHRDVQACASTGRGRVRASTCPQLLQPERTMLGADQEAWLHRHWSLQHRWNLLAQQTLMSPLSLEADAQDPEVWTDGWDGYAPARQRLLEGALQRKVPGLVVLGGDIHAHAVAQLRAGSGAQAPLVGAEFCTTSISSRGPSPSSFETALGRNPDIVFGQSRHRGSVQFTLDERELMADLRAVLDVEDAGSAVRSMARFALAPERAQLHRA